MEVHVSDLDVKKWKDSVISIIGSRNSGKTLTGLSIASQLQIPQWLVFCDTEEAKEFWTEKLGSKRMVVTKRPCQRLLRIIQFQEKRLRYVTNVRDVSIGLIFDEYNPILQETKEVYNFFTNCQEYYCTIITISHNVPPTTFGKYIVTRSSKSLLLDIYNIYTKNKNISDDEFVDIAYAIFNDDSYNGFAINAKEKDFSPYHRLIPMNINFVESTRLGDHEWQKFLEKYDD